MPSGLVHASSDVVLRNDVTAKTVGPRLSPMKRICEVPQLDQDYPVYVADVLLYLGFYSSPRSKKRFASLARYWPVLKYLGLFECDSYGYLKLTDQADFYSHRNRALLSEELGIGFGMVAAEKWIRDVFHFDTVEFIDVERLIADNNACFNIHVGKSTTRADWLVLGGKFDKRSSRAFLCECKGTSSTRRHNKVLGEALEQISQMIVDGKKLPGLAVCTYSGNRQIKVYALDPPADEDAPVELTMSNDRILSYAASLNRSVTERSFTDTTGDSFRNSLSPNFESTTLAPAAAIQSAINLSHWSSNWSLINKLSGLIGSSFSSFERSPLEQPLSLNTGVGRASGFTVQVPFTNFEVFCGAIDSVVDAYVKYDFDSALSIRAEIGAVLRNSDSRPAAENVPHNQIAISSTGAVLAVLGGQSESRQGSRSWGHFTV